MKEQEDTFGLKPIWNGLLSVYEEFARLCDKHGLRYYLSDGNVLGIVRHGGFIPWDDDLDVSMPRPDYEKFLKIAERELPENLKIVRWQNTPEYNLLFAKVQETRKEYVEEIEKETGRILSNGIYIDIFPIDGYPKSKISVRLHKCWFLVLKSLLRFHCDCFMRQTRKGKIVWITGMFLAPLFPWLWTHNQIMPAMDNLIQEIDFNEADLTGRSWDDYGLYGYPPCPKSIWGRPKVGNLCGVDVKLPEKPEDFLKIRYGDYMKLPPEEKRKPAHQYSWRCAWWLGPTSKTNSK